MYRIMFSLLVIAGVLLLASCDSLNFLQPTPTSTNTPTPVPTKTPIPKIVIECACPCFSRTIVEAYMDKNDNGKRDPEDEPLDGVVFHAEWYEFMEGPSCTKPAGEKTVKDWTSDAAGRAEIVSTGCGCGDVEINPEPPLGYQTTTKEECCSWGFAPLDLNYQRQPSPIKITIFVGFGTGTSPEQQAVHQQIQDLYNSTHTDIQIEFLTVPWAEHYTKYVSMLAADQLPDIVMPIGVGAIAEFHQGWEDLAPYIEADSYDMTHFAGNTVTIHDEPGQGMVGLPLCVYPSLIYYNQDLFDAAGVAYPPARFGEPYDDGDPWTYDKLFEIAKLLTLDKNDNNAASPDFDPANIVQFGWDGWDWGSPADFTIHFGEALGTGVSADGKTALLTTPQYLTAFTYLKDNIWTDHLRANGEQSNLFYQDAGDPMSSGMVAMWEVHSWMGYAYPSWSEKFKWNVAAIPSGTNGEIEVMVDADTAVIPAASRHKDAAWEVMKWLFEPGQYNLPVKNYACMPADSVSLDAWISEQSTKNPGVNFSLFRDALDYIEVVNHESWKPDYTNVNQVIEEAKNAIINGENPDVEKVLQEANAKVQALLDAYWVNNP